MKTIKFLIAMVAIIFVGTTYYSCQKETQTTSVQDGAITNTLKSTYTGCESCINLAATPVQYFEKAESQTVYWGNGKFDKTVTIIFYNTDTSFVLKVKSTNGWSNLIIDGASAWNNGPVAPNLWGEITLPLPTDWEACDNYSFNLQVAGGGPQAVFFNVVYQLVGICQGVTDYDGNVYTTVEICDQTWMVENLKTTKYNDGTPISNITDNNVWMGFTDGAYCWLFNNESTYKDTYGALYNWYAIASGKLAPIGWHVPSDEELTVLTDCCGGEVDAAGPLKEAGTAHWFEPNVAATNESGWTALPGGWRNSVNGCFGGTAHGHWWSTTESSATNAWFREMYWSSQSVFRYDYDKRAGFSVRCVKD
jgi:uncharacterized protein (TIGR02145 family)